MLQTRHTQPLGNNSTAARSVYTTPRATIFYPTHQAARYNRLLAIVLIVLSLTGSALLALAAIFFWPTYTHPFTPYLKWQDALLAILGYGSFILLIASITLTRFHLASRRGQRDGILILYPHNVLTVRDLSPKNFYGTYRMIAASFTCFLGALTGLAPCILIGWTLHLGRPIFVLSATALAILISLAGLILTLLSTTFLVISLIGARAFTRTLGAPHTYPLNNLTNLRIDNLILTITYPDRPETLFDLNLLHPHDQRHLLQLLQKHSLQAYTQPHAHPALGQHIEAALQDSLNRPRVSA